MVPVVPDGDKSNTRVDFVLFENAAGGLGGIVSCRISAAVSSFIWCLVLDFFIVPISSSRPFAKFFLTSPIFLFHLTSN